MAVADDKYTAALIGCGRIGFLLGNDSKREQPASHTKALLENPRIILSAGCDTNVIRLRDWYKSNPEVEVYMNSEQLFQNRRPDLVVVAVNEAAHIREAVNAIVSRPKLVILEKPVALNLAEAFVIQKEAQRNNVPVLINHERRFATDYALARSCLPKIGKIQRICGSLFSGMTVYSQEAENTGEYSLLHDGTHLVDAVLSFLEPEFEPSLSYSVPYYKPHGLYGKAMCLSGESDRYVNSLLNHPVITGVYREENGEIKQLCAHYETPVCPDVTLMFSGRSRYFGFDLDIFGTEGRIRIGNGYLKLYRRTQSSLYSGFYSLEKDLSVESPKKTGYLSNMIQHAVDFMDGNVQLKSPLQCGINALAVIEEIKMKIQ